VPWWRLGVEIYAVFSGCALCRSDLIKTILPLSSRECQEVDRSMAEEGDNTMDASRLERYHEKLSNLKKYYSLLKKWLDSADLDDLTRDDNIERIFAVYHSFQLAIEVIIDISAMIVKDLGFDPADNYENFQALQRENIISAQLQSNLRDMNGLRNRIVHDYNGIVDETAWASIKKNFSSIPKFQEAIQKWLQSMSSGK
jgi:uncharacterized protein YutE (UPF0331/DUF86 family)